MREQELKSKAFKRAENNLLNKLSMAFLKNYPHHVMPGYNLNRSPCIEEWNEENVQGLYQDFPYNCDLPKPLLPPAKLSRTVLSEVDPALQLLTLKSHLKADINRIIKYYEKHKKEFKVVHKKSIKWKRGSNGYSANVPRYIADIAELLDMDPDPYFEGTYNWYYTGGSLNYVQLNGWDVLLFPFVGDLVAAHIVPMEDFVWKPLLQNSAKCKLHGLLYEIRQCKISNTCRILGRHKDHCTLYTLSNFENHLLLNEIHKQASKIPYVSADLSLTNTNYHCTLNVERILSLWDINNANYISSGFVGQNNSTTHTHDAWGCVRFQETDPNVLIYVDRCCLHYLDTRTSLDRACITLCPKFNLENCESLSIEVPSKHNCCRYLGTSHSFVMCDNRSPKQCVRQKWTHQFKDTPLLAAVTNNDDKEIIILSTQKAGENTIILNTWINEEESHSFNLPFTPPHIAETLNKSQTQGMCLNPYLRSRFELCNVGSTLITNVTNAGVSFFVQNSIGDIFYQCVTHENVLDKYSPINSKACYALDMWEKALSAQAEQLVPLSFTDKCNMQYIYENFTNKTLDPRLKSVEENADDDFEPTWKQSLAALGSYIDLLAPELLAVWDMREEVPVPVVAGSHQKVWNWLEASTSNYPVTQSQDEPKDIPTPINTQELISVSQEHDLMYIDDSNMLQEMLLPKVKSIVTKKKRI